MRVIPVDSSGGADRLEVQNFPSQCAIAPASPTAQTSLEAAAEPDIQMRLGPMNWLCVLQAWPSKCAITPIPPESRPNAQTSEAPVPAMDQMPPVAEPSGNFAD